ncbi:MAG TPA: cytochrome c3 family protein, partial [Burkholderiales bacterium]
PYTSGSLDANAIQGALDQPGGSSKLCLSCHDGTLAVGSVNVLNGQGSSTAQGTVGIDMTGTGAGGAMPPGAGTSTGFTRNLGVDLKNDHPISVTYNSLLATRDGELRPVDAAQKWPPGSGSVIGPRAPGARPAAPLEPTGASGAGQVQCGTCHDPHVRETDAAKGNQKFLRLNRFQEAAPANTLDTANDIACLACHDKNIGGGVWAYSAHANPLVAQQTYTPSAAALREFPANLPAWKASCLNCHDPHTAQGAQHLAREGTSSAASPKAGGAAASEETCYQCHSPTPALLNPGNLIPDIRTDFSAARRMPITVNEPGGDEAHDIGGVFSDAGVVDCSGAANGCGKDMVESRTRLGHGPGNLGNRHVECSDCHNPHRVVKFRDFRGNPAGTLNGAPDPAGTHRHDDATGYTHTNIASGVLRGGFGVEPSYGSASFQSLPAGYLVKRGDPGAGLDTSIAASYVTREYQICLRCHSDYAYSDDNLYPSGNTRPLLGGAGLTPPAVTGRTNYTRYTNQAKEFQAPLAHRGQVSTTDSGAGPAFGTNNHRSWHPVMDATGRSATLRGAGSNISANWLLPWRNAVGTQTMYCSDCHGSAVASNTSVVPDNGENGKPWGPHGSGNDFILKGTWNSASGSGQSSTVCFKCHQQNVYAPTDGGGSRTGFWTNEGKDGHFIHSPRDRLSRSRCNWCHVAVPHGWKNKALLVNLNDVGPEAGLAPGTAVPNSALPYSNGPYYRNAMLKVKSFKASGAWTQNDCGAVGQDSRDWMRNTCGNPP